MGIRSRAGAFRWHSMCQKPGTDSLPQSPVSWFGLSKQPLSGGNKSKNREEAGLWLCFPDSLTLVCHATKVLSIDDFDLGGLTSFLLRSSDSMSTGDRNFSVTMAGLSERSDSWMASWYGAERWSSTPTLDLKEKALYIFIWGLKFWNFPFYSFISTNITIFII